MENIRLRSNYLLAPMPQKNPFWFLMALVFMLVLAKSANITDDRLVSTTDHCTAQITVSFRVWALNWVADARIDPGDSRNRPGTDIPRLGV